MCFGQNDGGGTTNNYHSTPAAAPVNRPATGRNKKSIVDGDPTLLKGPKKTPGKGATDSNGLSINSPTAPSAIKV